MRSCTKAVLRLQSVAVNISDDSTILFPTCNTLGGRSDRVRPGRRDGRPVVLLPPNWAHKASQQACSSLRFDDLSFCVNFDEVERRTWSQILSTIGINAIAREEGVSRAAIYARIQGNSKGQGGMTGENVWVLLWWRMRQRTTAGVQ